MDVYESSFMAVIQLQLITVLCVYQHTSVLLIFYLSRVCRLGSERESLALQAVLVGGPRYMDAPQDSKQGSALSHPQLLQPR